VPCVDQVDTLLAMTLGSQRLWRGDANIQRTMRPRVF